MSDLRDEIYDLINVSRYEMAATREDIIDDILAAVAEALTSEAVVTEAAIGGQFFGDTDRWMEQKPLHREIYIEDAGRTIDFALSAAGITKGEGDDLR